MNDVLLVEAYSRLRALKDHVPGPHIHPKYVAEFHQILDLLQARSGVNLANFRIPSDEIKPQIVTVIRGRYARYSTEPYCERALFEMRVDGVLTMFQFLGSSAAPGKAPIGFNPSGS